MFQKYKKERPIKLRKIAPDQLTNGQRSFVVFFSILEKSNKIGIALLSLSANSSDDSKMKTCAAPEEILIEILILSG